MAGVIALDHGPQPALALRRLDAARQIARRELRRLTELARSREIGEDEMRHVVAFNGLVGGLPITDLRKAVAETNSPSRSDRRTAWMLYWHCFSRNCLREPRRGGTHDSPRYNPI